MGQGQWGHWSGSVGVLKMVNEGIGQGQWGIGKGQWRRWSGSMGA